MPEAILDANVLLRYLTNEPRHLADRTASLLDAIEVRGITPLVAPLTLAEVVFVLESVYQWNRRDIADRLLGLISASVIQFLEHATISQALVWYRDLRVHFADAYLAALAAARQSTLVSFDRGLKRAGAVKVVDRPEDL
jgi:predicted nucleic-acid-binding protein